METHCLRHSEIPGTSRLFLDYVYNFDRLCGFYYYAPHDYESYVAAASKIDYPQSRRQAMVAALRKINGDSEPLEKLAQPGTVAVVTGQQAGLFSGPAYTIYKALTAARLARELSERGTPAVPIFWIATEDHDFAEVNHAHVFTKDGQAVHLRTEGDGAANQPVGSIYPIHPPVDELAAALASFPDGEEVAQAVREAYRPGVRMGCAFRQLLSGWLKKFGILFLDPLDPAIREIGAPFLKAALEAAPALNPKLRARSKELAERGYHAQVLVEDDTSLLFRLDGNRRIPLRLKNDWPDAELASAPEQLSPNALLRPVFQDYLLPTVAYVGGAAELAYLAQSEVIYRELLGRMPVILARNGFTLLDRRSYSHIERLGLAVPSFFAPVDTVRERIAARMVPASLTERYAEARKSQSRLLDSLRAETLRFDPTLGKAIDRTKAKLEYQLAKMERKVARETLRRDERGNKQADALTSLIYPEKHLQERYYSILPFVAEYGPQLFNDLFDNIHFDCPDHKIAII